MLRNQRTENTSELIETGPFNIELMSSKVIGVVIALPIYLVLSDVILKDRAIAVGFGIGVAEFVEYFLYVPMKKFWRLVDERFFPELLE